MDSPGAIVDDQLRRSDHIADFPDYRLVKLRFDGQKNDVCFSGLAVGGRCIDTEFLCGFFARFCMRSRSGHFVWRCDPVPENPSDDRLCHVSTSDKSKFHRNCPFLSGIS